VNAPRRGTLNLDILRLQVLRLRQELIFSDGKMTDAAHKLSVNPHTAYRWLARYRAIEDAEARAAGYC
jgi:transposase-like protein